jgi:hypothetical protein
VESSRGAVSASRPIRFPDPLPEPGMRLPPHPALHRPRCQSRPSAQLGLDLQYPQAGLIEARPRRVGIHRRPPDIPATALPACWVPSPCNRLSRSRTTTDPPSHPAFTTSRSTGSAPSSSPCSIATSTPQIFLAASPPAALGRLRSSRSPTARAVRAAPRPSTRLEPVSRLRGLNPSGGAGPPRLRRGCSRPHPRFRGQAAASFIRAAATARRRSPFISARFVAPRGAQCRGDPHVALLRRPLNFRHPAACRTRAAAGSPTPTTPATKAAATTAATQHPAGRRHVTPP